MNERKILSRLGPPDEFVFAGERRYFLYRLDLRRRAYWFGASDPTRAAFCNVMFRIDGGVVSDVGVRGIAFDGLIAHERCTIIAGDLLRDYEYAAPPETALALAPPGELLESFDARADCDSYEDTQRTTYRQVRWSDFQGPRPARRLGGMKDVIQKAHIATSIRIEPFDIDVRNEGPRRWVARSQGLCVRSFMLKQLSGYRIEERTRRVLRHEQGHFDITEQFVQELHGRLIGLEHRADSPEKATRGLRNAVKREYAKTIAYWKATQSRYDRETRHNANRVVQKRWLRTIAGLLPATESSGAGSTFEATTLMDP